MSNSYELERKRLYDSLAACANENDFWSLAHDIRLFQIENNELFKALYQYTKPIATHNQKLNFLPISFFKSHEVKTGFWKEEKVFLSSGTTQASSSRHMVRNLISYLQNATFIFQQQYGAIEDYCFLCLLPSYLERDGSSLISMCDHFIRRSTDERSAFYLYDHEKLAKVLNVLKFEGKKTILMGVSYALLDFAERYRINGWNDLVVMKTGGMKGKRPEMNAGELDQILTDSFGVNSIHGEYGMTECLSQMYSHGGNGYKENNRFKVVLTDLTDPFTQVKNGKNGRVNVIDLANIDSCAFIATDDIGYKDANGYVHILGRIDNSDLRGCNLLL